MSLKDQMTADLSGVFFNPDEFADAADVVLGSAAAKVVNGIFHNPYAPINVHDVTIEAGAIAFVCAASAVTALSHGDSMTINSTAYYVREVMPDNIGTVTLMLTEDDHA